MGGSSHSQTFLLDTWNNRDGPTRKMEVMVGQNDWVTWSNILIVIAFMMVVLWAGDDIFYDDPHDHNGHNDHNDRNCDQQRFSILTLLHCGGKYLQGKVNQPKLIIGGKVKVKKRTFQNCSCSMINCVGGKLKVKKEPTINIGVDQNIIHLN